MKKRVLSIILASIFAIMSVFVPFYEAQAVPLMETFFASLPLTWPLMVKMFQALGIGTAEYFNSLPYNDKLTLAENLTLWLTQANLTLISDATVDSGSAGSGYIKSVVRDNINYISKDIMDSVADFAQANNMLGGERTGSVSIESTASLAGITINSTYFADPLKMINSWSPKYANPAQVAAIISIVSGLSGNYWIHAACTSANSYCDLQIVPQSYYIGKKLTVAYNFTYNWSYETNATSNPSTYYSYRITTSGGISTYGNPGKGISQNKVLNGPELSNFGVFSETESGGIPIGVGETQVIDNNGAWELPYDANDVIDIDNYGEAVPVSVPSSDVISWPADATGVTDLALDVIDVADSIADSVAGTQAIAQEGTISLPEEIATSPDIIATIPALTVPNWITRRFPFSIPFDIKNALMIFSQVQAREPPELTWIFYYGRNSEYYYTFHIDFDLISGGIKLFRFGVFALFLAGLINATRRLVGAE